MNSTRVMSITLLHSTLGWVIDYYFKENNCYLTGLTHSVSVE